jgi:ABC-type multidrug transport system, ATPase and permease components
MDSKFSYKNFKNVFPNILFMLKYVIKYNKSFLFYKMIFVFMETFTTYINLNLTRWILDTIDFGEINETMTTIVIAAVTIVVCNIFTSFFNTVKYPQMNITFSRKMLEELISKVKKIDQIHFEEKDFFDIYTRALNEINGRADGVVNTIYNFLSFALQAMMIITVTSFINIEIMFVGLIVTIIGAVTSFNTNRLSYAQNVENTQNAREMNYIKRITYQPEYLVDLKIYNNYLNLMTDKNTKSSENYKKIHKKYSIKIFIYNTVFTFVNILLVIVVPCFIVMNLLKTGSISVGEATILINSANILPNRLNRLFSTINELFSHSLYITNLRDMLEYETNIEVTKGTVLDKINDITIKNLTFSYDSTKQILNDINFNIKRGMKISIAGYNGSGKSTLAKLLLRLYDPSNGTISINGVSETEINIDSLRKNISLLNQDYRIYSFSVAENVLMKPLSEFSEEDYETVNDALKKVVLYDKIYSYKDNILSNITREFYQNGIYLSGGELQRLAIARVIAVDSDFIILDEPDSALDPVNQNEIFKLIFSELNDKTMIIISHKMALVQQSDYVFFMENGCIKEHGTHNELMQLQGEYCKFYRSQADNYS